jgi:glycosyltransferase involved in cell wall biosynthesis
LSSHTGAAAGRVAFITPTPPVPLVSGERIRYFHLMRELAERGWSVSLFSLVQPEAAPALDDRALLGDICDEVMLAPFSPSPVGRRLRLARDIVARRAFHRDFFVTDEALEAGSRWIAESDCDVLVVGQLFMFPYAPQSLMDRAVLDTHNVEARRIATIARALRRTPKGLAASLQVGPVERLEQEAASRVARLTAVSDLEYEYFDHLAAGRVDLVPNGVDCRRLAVRDEVPRGPNVLFLGSLDYSANIDAVVYLAREILPEVIRRDAAVTIVGSHPKRAVYDAAAQSSVPMEIAGFVEDTNPYWGKARVFAVPLRIGGGTRLKILEALARGVPVLTTSLGCEGLAVRHEEEVIMADTPEEFAGWLDRLLEDDELCQRLVRRGRRTVEERYDWSRIGELFDRTAHAAMAESRQG